jgi:hypothetical protein
VNRWANGRPASRRDYKCGLKVPETCVDCRSNGDVRNDQERSAAS